MCPGVSQPIIMLKSKVATAFPSVPCFESIIDHYGITSDNFNSVLMCASNHKTITLINLILKSASDIMCRTKQWLVICNQIELCTALFAHLDVGFRLLLLDAKTNIVVEGYSIKGSTEMVMTEVATMANDSLLR